MHVARDLPLNSIVEAAIDDFRVFRIECATACQQDLGSGGPGTAVLSICGGDLSAGTTADLEIVGLPASALTFVVFSSQNNPTPLFGGTFFLITGLHMTHVLIGVVYLAIIARGFGNGKFDAEDVEVSGLYWHFVDLVWMFVFPMIYLLSTKVN